jgi:Major Facilitator Superfamily/Crp-like helix-turn-helix domain
MSVQDKAKVPPVATMQSVPRTVVALGFVSLFMDLSSEIIHSLLPVFLVTVLGAGALSVGLIEGIAEATSQIAKLFSGAISDWIGKRKLLVLLGYGIAALTKPLFPLASSVGVVLVARFVDRIGKGIRGAPRDALIGDITPVELRGTAFGLRLELRNIRSARERVLQYLRLRVHNRSIAVEGQLQDIAAEIGITREALYRTLAALEAEGCLTRRGTAILLKKNLTAHDSDHAGPRSLPHRVAGINPRMRSSHAFHS